MTVGFIILIAFTFGISIIGMIQINTLDGYIKNFTEQDMVRMETIDKMLYEAELIIRETYVFIYVVGESHHVENETIIDHILEHIEIFNSFLDLLEELDRGHIDDLMCIRGCFECIIDDITCTDNGIIIHAEEINTQLNESVEIREQVDVLIDELVGLDGDFQIKLNATMLKSHLSEQGLFSN